MCKDTEAHFGALTHLRVKVDSALKSLGQDLSRGKTDSYAFRFKEPDLRLVEHTEQAAYVSLMDTGAVVLY